MIYIVLYVVAWTVGWWVMLLLCLDAQFAETMLISHMGLYA